MSKEIQKATDSYKRKCPGKFALAYEVRRCMTLKIEQFPEAYCTDSSHLLALCSPDFQVVCGQFKNSKMNRRALHVWVFDTKEHVHIDITADQFPTEFGREIAVMPKTAGFMKSMGYSLTDLDMMTELFEGPFKHYGNLAKTKVSHGVTLLDVAKCSKLLMESLNLS